MIRTILQYTYYTMPYSVAHNAQLLPQCHAVFELCERSDCDDVRAIVWSR
jgi:hypothetical protein